MNSRRAASVAGAAFPIAIRPPVRRPGASTRYQFTESLRPLPALNLGCVDALIVIGSPVRGLRPVEALRLATENVPNPTRRTSSPFDSAVVMVSNTPSTAFVASLRESPLASATAPISSFLFMSGRTPSVVLLAQELASPRDAGN